MRAESFPALIPKSSLQNRPMVSTSLKDISGTKEYLRLVLTIGLFCKLDFGINAGKLSALMEPLF